MKSAAAGAIDARFLSGVPSAAAASSLAARSAPQHNGNLSATSAVAATGDARINGLLVGYKWSGPITYADTDAPGDYQAGYISDANENSISAQNEGFSRFTAQQIKALHAALTTTIYTQDPAAGAFSVSGFTNLNVTYAGAGNSGATIRAANSTDAVTAYAYNPSSDEYGGDTFFGSANDGSSASLKTPVAGNYAWYTMYHELGHSLGLKHGHETDGLGGAVPANFDSFEFTLMTYRSYVGASIEEAANEDWGFPQTFMMLDIAALQAMYGADYTANSGDTVYAWSPFDSFTRVNDRSRSRRATTASLPPSGMAAATIRMIFPPILPICRLISPRAAILCSAPGSARFLASANTLAATSSMP
jgi:serralysin